MSIRGHAPAPVTDAGANMRRHRLCRRLAVAFQERFDDGKMLVPFLGDTMVVVALLVVLPGDISEGAEQRLEPAQLIGEIRVATRVGNEIVQAAIKNASLLDERGLG